MKLKKSFSFSDKNQIWRLLISDADQLIVETRNTDQKEVFFHCIDLVNGKKVFKNLQLEEKYWLGIEVVYNGIIFFHSFAKPNMPEHKKIIAYDISQNKIIWQNDQLAFLSLKDDKIYAFRKKFEGQDVFVIDYLTGNIIEELGNNFKKVNEILEEVHLNEDFSQYKYPEPLDMNNLEVKSIIDNEIDGKNIVENIDLLKYDNLVAFNYYMKNPNNSFDNMFVIYDIKKGKKVYAEVLNKNLNSIAPDSFFGYKNNILLLKNKNEIISYKLV